MRRKSWVLAVATTLSAAAAMAAAEETKSVTVTNDATRPVATQATGVTAVSGTVGATQSGPWLVKVDSKGTGAILVDTKIWGHGPVGSTIGTPLVAEEGFRDAHASFPDSPPLHLRIWQHVSGRITVPHGQIPEVWLQVGQRRHYVSVRRIREEAGFSDTYQFGEPITVYQGPSDHGHIFVDRAAIGGEARMEWTMSGRLVKDCASGTLCE
jgi:hypothetical protein